MTSGGDQCRAEIARRVCLITLAAPDSRNALGLPITRQLRDHVVGAANDDTVRVVVIDHEGPVFSAGWDLNLTPADGRVVDALLVEVLETIRDMRQPVVAKVGGPAIGGALGLVAACDLSVVSRRTSFGFGEVRLGLAPTTAAVHCVPKMRPADALWALLVGARFDGDRAVALGLVNLAVEPEELDAAVASLVGELLLGGPNALAACKVLARSITSADAGAYALAARHNEELVGAAEALEGIAAYMERRRPSWAPAEDHPPATRA